MPSLRERHDDIPLLVNYFLKKHSKPGLQKEVANSVMGKLVKYDWPGNVRELENTIERLIIFSEGPQINHLPESFSRPPALSESHKIVVLDAEDIPASFFIGEVDQPLDKAIRKTKKEHVKMALVKTGWDVGAAAKILGVYRTTVYDYIDDFNYAEDTLDPSL